jgi:predicted RNase H-like HicB family nuclease
MKKVSFQDFVKEVLRGAEYKKGKDLDCVVAIARDLPGCMTQGDNHEEARENLIDAIELWIASALRDGERIPSVRGNELILVRARSTQRNRKAAHA